ncbi:MAG: LuxR C-terminal-related transcriptional regulator [Acidimicrobiales bacterium]
MLGVAGAIQRAVTPHEVQTAYLASIPSVIEAGGHGIYVLDPKSRRPLDVVATVPDSFLQRYEDEGRSDDPVLKGAIATKEPVDSANLPKGMCWTTSAVFPVLQAAGFRHSLEAPVIVNGEVRATLNMVRRADDAPFGEHDRLAMALVADQVGAALTRSERYDRVERDTLLLADALDAAPQAVVVMTADGDLVFHNRMADRLVPGSSTTYLEKVEPMLDAALDEIRSGAKRVVTTFDRGRADADTLPTADGVPLALKGVRLRGSHNAVVFFISHRPGASSGLPSGPIHLSPREWSIANLVSRGLTNRQIAELSFVSENTVKQHLKRIFTKLEVSSRAQLVQTLWAANAPREGQILD